MSPEPIRDYVGEALARFGNGKAAVFNTYSARDDAMSAPNWIDLKDGGFRCEATEVPNQERESRQQKHPKPRPTEQQWKLGSFTAKQLQEMKFPPTSFLVQDIVPAEGVTLLCSKPNRHSLGLALVPSGD